MTFVPVSHFLARFDTRSNSGQIQIVTGTATFPLTNLPGPSFSAVLAILREEPVYFDPATWTLATGPEQPGD